MSRTVLLLSATVVLGLVAALVAASVSQKAEAAFPGSNGAIAYVSEQLVSEDLEKAYVYSVNPDGTEVRRLADAGGASPPAVSPTWSTDGKRIVFSTGGDVYRMNADGTREVNLTNDPVNNGYPAFYPSGRKIVYDSSSDLYSLSFDRAGKATGPPTRLTHHVGTQPAVSPDGKKVAFTATRGVGWGNYWEIYVMKANVPEGPDNRPQKLTNDVQPYGIDEAPAWSPDGKRIAYTKGYNGNVDPDNLSDIVVMNSDGTGKKNLTKDVAGYHADPAFSPDGRWIASASIRDGEDWEIWKMRADGTRATQVTKNTYPDRSPDWQPLP